jgi:hypothetical protein
MLECSGEIDIPMGRMIGVVPSSILKRFCLRTPAMTDTGQSGPPTKMTISGYVMPLSCE